MPSWSIFDGSNLSFYHHPESASLECKNGGPTSLVDLCKATTPPCHLNPLLFNGHLQTFWTTVESQDVPIYYKRKVFDADVPSHAGSFIVDFAVSPYDGADMTLPPRTTYFADSDCDAIGSLDSKPMLVTLHGLSGGSHELYLRHCLKPLVDDGWEACVVNSRGCGKSKITSGVLYNARSTWDVRQVVKWLKDKFPNRPLFGLGFSLGANIMVNYLGEEGPDCVLKAAVVCSNPFNLEAGSLALQRSWIGMEVYQKYMGTSMRNLFETHIEDIAKNSRVNIEKVRKVKYLFEFDRDLQGPTWGYPTEGAYYRDASSADSVLAVRTPLLAFHAEDDPIAAKEALPFGEIKQNPFTILCTTYSGGHLGWFETGGGRWYARATTQFFQRMAKDIDLEKLEEIRRGFGRGQKDTPAVEYDPMRRKLTLDVNAKAR